MACAETNSLEQAPLSIQQEGAMQSSFPSHSVRQCQWHKRKAGRTAAREPRKRQSKTKTRLGASQYFPSTCNTPRVTGSYQECLERRRFVVDPLSANYILPRSTRNLLEILHMESAPTTGSYFSCIKLTHTAVCYLYRCTGSATIIMSATMPKL